MTKTLILKAFTNLQQKILEQAETETPAASGTQRLLPEAYGHLTGRAGLPDTHKR